MFYERKPNHTSSGSGQSPRRRDLMSEIPDGLDRLVPGLPLTAAPGIELEIRNHITVTNLSTREFSFTDVLLHKLEAETGCCAKILERHGARFALGGGYSLL